MPNDHPDILEKLAHAALDAGSIAPAQMEALLHEAIEVIETLRTLVDIKGDILMEDIAPAGIA